MIRIVVLAAATAALALPAAAAEPSIRIPIAGKSPEQLRTAVVKAASTLCWRAGEAGASLPLEAHRACVQRTVKATYAKAALPEAMKLARR